MFLRLTVMYTKPVYTAGSESLAALLKGPQDPFPGKVPNTGEVLRLREDRVHPRDILRVEEGTALTLLIRKDDPPDLGVDARHSVCKS